MMPKVDVVKQAGLAVARQHPRDGDGTAFVIEDETGGRASHVWRSLFARYHGEKRQAGLFSSDRPLSPPSEGADNNYRLREQLGLPAVTAAEQESRKAR